MTQDGPDKQKKDEDTSEQEAVEEQKDQDQSESENNQNKSATENKDTGTQHKEDSGQSGTVQLSVKSLVAGVFVLGVAVGFAGGVLAGNGGLIVAQPENDAPNPSQAESKNNVFTPENVQTKIKQFASDEGVSESNIQSCIENGNPMNEVNGDKRGILQLDTRMGTPTAIVGGRKVVGAQPYSQFKQVIDDQLEGNSDSGSINTDKLEISNEPVLGEEDVNLTMFIYEDYQCPFCKRFETQTFPKIKSNYVDSGKVKVVWKDFPAPSLGHDWAEPAAAAMECVYREGGNKAFWNVKQKVFEEAKTLS